MSPACRPAMLISASPYYACRPHGPHSTARLAFLRRHFLALGLRPPNIFSPASPSFPCNGTADGVDRRDSEGAAVPQRANDTTPSSTDPPFCSTLAPTEHQHRRCIPLVVHNGARRAVCCLDGALSTFAQPSGDSPHQMDQQHGESPVIRDPWPLHVCYHSTTNPRLWYLLLGRDCFHSPRSEPLVVRWLLPRGSRCYHHVMGDL